MDKNSRNVILTQIALRAGSKLIRNLYRKSIKGCPGSKQGVAMFLHFGDKSHSLHNLLPRILYFILLSLQSQQKKSDRVQIHSLTSNVSTVHTESVAHQFYPFDMALMHPLWMMCVAHANISNSMNDCLNTPDHRVNAILLHRL